MPNWWKELTWFHRDIRAQTGIVGVLADACSVAGITHLVVYGRRCRITSPCRLILRGTLALLLRLNQWLGLRVDTAPLEARRRRFPGENQRSRQCRPQTLRFRARTQETRIRTVKLSVLVPASNEAQTLEEVVRRVRAFQVPKEIILVDDGSKDRARDKSDQDASGA